jgi:hypothetical protein
MQRAPEQSMQSHRRIQTMYNGKAYHKEYRQTDCYTFQCHLPDFPRCGTGWWFQRGSRDIQSQLQQQRRALLQVSVLCYKFALN